MADLRWMRVMLFTAVIVLAAGIGFAAAADGTQSPVEKKVTLQLADTPVIDVIDYMFRDTGYKYTIEPGVSGRITVGFKNMPLDQAIKAVADASNLDYRLDAGRYIFKPKAKATVAVESPQNSAQSDEQWVDEDMEPPVFDEGPVYYGSFFPEPYPPMPTVFDFGGVQIIDFYPYGGVFILNPQSTYRGAPAPLVPPELRSPSYQRFLDQMYSVHSVPGYPVWGLEESYDRPYGRPFGHRYLR